MSEVQPKPSRAKMRYSNPPKIKNKGGTESAPAGEKPKSSPGDATVANAKPTGDTPGAAPAADVMAGTDGIDVTARHAQERDEMVARHSKELSDMHKRHQDDHSTIAARHLAEMGGGGAPDKTEG